MPRGARQKSETGIYHVMLRGINKQNIFEEPEDYEKMRQLLIDCQKKDGFALYAYCFMPNHIHLLMREAKTSVSESIRGLGSKYVSWFNTKYERVGHLFQDRFKSEAVEDDNYFMTVVRYIHCNPVKAKLVKTPEAYAYSSYRDYLDQREWIDAERVQYWLHGEQFEEFHKRGTDEVCMDIPEAVTIRLTEEAATSIMRTVTKCGSSAEFQGLDTDKKKKLIKRLKAKGLSIRQISRLTGETYYLIQKA